MVNEQKRPRLAWSNSLTWCRGRLERLKCRHMSWPMQLVMGTKMDVFPAVVRIDITELSLIESGGSQDDKSLPSTGFKTATMRLMLVILKRAAATPLHHDRRFLSADCLSSRRRPREACEKLCRRSRDRGRPHQAITLCLAMVCWTGHHQAAMRADWRPHPAYVDLLLLSIVRALAQPWQDRAEDLASRLRAPFRFPHRLRCRISAHDWRRGLIRWIGVPARNYKVVDLHTPPFLSFLFIRAAGSLRYTLARVAGQRLSQSLLQQNAHSVLR